MSPAAADLILRLHAAYCAFHTDAAKAIQALAAAFAPFAGTPPAEMRRLHTAYRCRQLARRRRNR